MTTPRPDTWITTHSAAQILDTPTPLDALRLARTHRIRTTYRRIPGETLGDLLAFQKRGGQA